MLDVLKVLGGEEGLWRDVGMAGVCSAEVGSVSPWTRNGSWGQTRAMGLERGDKGSV